MKTLQISLLIIFSSFSFIACQEENEGTSPENTATIEVTSPNDDKLFEFGETVHIQATVTADKEMHGYKIEVRNLFGEVIYETDEHTHGKELMIDEEWINNVEKSGVYLITIIVALDHDGNLGQETIKVILNGE